MPQPLREKEFPLGAAWLAADELKHPDPLRPPLAAATTKAGKPKKAKKK